MITINVTEQDIILAKEMTATFDKGKVYNKFNCNNNYIGILGEMLLDRYFTSNNIEHQWVGVNKGVMNSPDFIIAGKTIDLKTTFTDSLWFQKPTHDIYLLATLSKDNKVLTIKGSISKEELINHIINKTCETIIRDKRMDYKLSYNKLHSVEVKENKIIFK